MKTDCFTRLHQFKKTPDIFFIEGEPLIQGHNRVPETRLPAKLYVALWLQFVVCRHFCWKQQCVILGVMGRENPQTKRFLVQFKQEVKVIWQKAPHGGAHSPVMGHPRGSKFVPLNSWGRVSYSCSIVTIVLGCTIWPQCTRVTTNQPTTNDVTTQPISISASFTNVKWGA